ncbi:unnamed protein product [Tetraodon nigroviridis]|uniref:(spotted green pufferfish) hypothetical protein n=1 Tax=Tetraodon nigroviridis TaxID=99883 RepID=Q4SSE7_TETNG|nr:unnamed protein product [Tetraodon nigroviridis]
MFSCRAAWQRCGPLARRAAYSLPRNVIQRRPMSSLPGGSGENIVYTLLCSGAFVGAISYAYSTVISDGARFNERIAEIKARPKTEWTPKPWPPKSKSAHNGRAKVLCGHMDVGHFGSEQENKSPFLLSSSSFPPLLYC